MMTQHATGPWIRPYNYSILFFIIGLSLHLVCCQILQVFYTLSVKHFTMPSLTLVSVFQIDWLLCMPAIYSHCMLFEALVYRRLCALALTFQKMLPGNAVRGKHCVLQQAFIVDSCILRVFMGRDLMDQIYLPFCISLVALLSVDLVKINSIQLNLTSL